MHHSSRQAIDRHQQVDMGHPLLVMLEHPLHRGHQQGTQERPHLQVMEELLLPGKEHQGMGAPLEDTVVTDKQHLLAEHLDTEVSHLEEHQDMVVSHQVDMGKCSCFEFSHRESCLVTYHY